MLNLLWAGMILVGMVWGVTHGRLEALGQAILSSGTEAVELSISMLGIMCIWSGVMEVAKKGGLITQLTRLLKPFVKWIFPTLPPDHPVMEHITLNMAANMLGLGWASTPSGLAAMKELAVLNNYSTSASNAMCDFLILNISSLQLIPVSVIAYRAQYGAVNPADITGPALVSTAASTGAAILLIRLKSRARRWGNIPHERGHS
jgi:spore maturation protein A